MEAGQCLSTTHIHLQVLVQAVAKDKLVRHRDALRLHRMIGPVVHGGVVTWVQQTAPVINMLSHHPRKQSIDVRSALTVIKVGYLLLPPTHRVPPPIPLQKRKTLQRAASKRRYAYLRAYRKLNSKDTVRSSIASFLYVLLDIRPVKKRAQEECLFRLWQLLKATCIVGF